MTDCVTSVIKILLSWKVGLLQVVEVITFQLLRFSELNGTFVKNKYVLCCAECVVCEEFLDIPILDRSGTLSSRRFGERYCQSSRYTF